MARGNKRANGEGSVSYRPQEKRWVGRVCLGWGENGKLKRQTVYGKTQAEVTKKMRELIHQRDNGMMPATDVTVETLMMKYIDSRRLLKRRSRTVESYEQLARRHIVPELGKRKVSTLKVADVQAWLDRKTADPELSERTVEYLRSLLRAAINFAIKREWVFRNVVCSTEIPPVPPRELPPLSVELAKRLLRAFQGHYLEALFTISIALGVRPGEVLGLRWENVHLDQPEDERFVEIELQLQRQAGEYRLTDTKTPMSRRSLFLPQLAAEALIAHRERQANLQSLLRDDWSNKLDLVFTTDLGEPLSDRRVRKDFKKLLKNAGLPEMRQYDLRHVYTSLMVAQNQHIKTISAALGHASDSSTWKVYAHVMRETAKEAAQAIDSAVGQLNESA